MQRKQPRFRLYLLLFASLGFESAAGGLLVQGNRGQVPTFRDGGYEGSIFKVTRYPLQVATLKIQYVQELVLCPSYRTENREVVLRGWPPTTQEHKDNCSGAVSRPMGYGVVDAFNIEVIDLLIGCASA